MVQFSDWKHFSLTQVNSFDAELDEAQLRGQIRKNIVIPFQDEKLKDFVVDFHFYNFSFCKDEAFDGRKISTLMSILNDVFVNDMTSSDPANTMSQSFNKFKDDLLRHSVERPPKSIKIFERKEVEKILTFVTNSYYRRFRLYKYAFTEKVVRQYTQVMPQEVEIPCVSPPLGLAIAIQSRVRVVEEDGEQNDNEFEDEEE